MQRDRDARAFGRDHHRHELVRQLDLVAIAPVVAHQQPAREPRLDPLARVRCRALRDLDDERLDIAEQQCPQRRALVDGGQKARGVHPQGGVVVDLDEHLMRRAVRAEQQCRAREPLATEDTDLRAPVIRGFGDDRGNAAFGEPDMLDRPIPRDQRPVAVKPLAREVRPHQRQIIGPECREQQVGGVGLVWVPHARPVVWGESAVVSRSPAPWSTASDDWKVGEKRRCRNPL